MDDLFKPSARAVQNENGFWFDPDSLMSGAFNRNHLYRSVNLMCVAVFDAGLKPVEYVVMRGGQPVYSHTVFEDVCCWADMMVIAEQKEAGPDA